MIKVSPRECAAIDRWTWVASSLSRFTLASAYNLLMDINEGAMNAGWEKVWSFKGPSRASMVL